MRSDTPRQKDQQCHEPIRTSEQELDQEPVRFKLLKRRKRRPGQPITRFPSHPGHNHDQEKPPMIIGMH